MSPDGSVIAAAGWTRWTEADPQEQIYLFVRATGVLMRRIDGLPTVVDRLAFSHDGGRLAAVLDRRGLRVYSAERAWTEVARDEAYENSTYGAAFAPDGRLATASDDGKVRLYRANLEGVVSPAVSSKAPSGGRPRGTAFSPDGSRLVVGNDDKSSLDLLNGRTLEALPGLNLTGIAGGTLSWVAWSRDGETVFAGGKYQSAAGCPVFAWSVNGQNARVSLPATRNTVTDLVTLPGGDVLVTAFDPWLARLAPDGARRWEHGPPTADFRKQLDRFAVSHDGTRVGFEGFGKSPVCFDVAERRVTPVPVADNLLAGPLQSGLPIEDWRGSQHPTLGGSRLPLFQYEISRSLAIDPQGGRLVLGTEWYLRNYDAKGTLLWARAAPAVVWAVNITGDGRLVVAAYGDGFDPLAPNP